MATVHVLTAHCSLTSHVLTWADVWSVSDSFCLSSPLAHYYGLWLLIKVGDGIVNGAGGGGGGGGVTLVERAKSACVNNRRQTAADIPVSSCTLVRLYTAA